MNRMLAAGAFASIALAALAGTAWADTVPDVVGLRSEEGARMLEAGGFRLEPSFDTSQPEGIVFSQEPGGLADRPQGTAIRVFIGGNPPAERAEELPPAGEPPPMPEAPPIPEAPPMPETPPAPEAPPTPQAAPIPVAPTLPEDAPPTGPPPRSQDWPLPPPSVTHPDAVPGAVGEPPLDTAPGLDALTASAIPEPMPNRDGPPLPNLIQRTEPEARSAFAGWQLRVEATLSSPEWVGRVLNQVPAPGETLAQGETVTIVIGLAELPSVDHHVVPPVEGLPAAEAKARIEREGFRVVVHSVPSTPDMIGRVVSQSPLPVSLGVKGGAILLRLGRGTPGRLPGAPRLPPTPPGSPGPFAPTGPPPSPPSGEIPSDLGAPPAGSGRKTPAGPDTGLPPLTPPPVVPPPVVPPPSISPVFPPAPPPSVPPGTPPGVPPAPPPVVPPVTPPTPPVPTPQKLGTAQPIAPAEGATFPRAYGATFQWTSVAGAQRYEWELQEEQTGTAWRTVATQVFKETRYRPERLERGRFRWRVRALSDTAQGDWSGFFRLFMY